MKCPLIPKLSGQTNQYDNLSMASACGQTGLTIGKKIYKLMKTLLYILCFLTTVVTLAQEKYLTKKGLVTFEASVPSFEEVKAQNKAATAIIDLETGELAVLVFIKGFRFKNALMEEHFNENYAESNTYPKATFKGQINRFHNMNFNESNKAVSISGVLNFHGVSKTIENTTVYIKRQNNTIHLTGTFKVSVSDFNITIPKIVKSKVSEDVQIRFEFELLKK